MIDFDAEEVKIARRFAAPPEYDAIGRRRYRAVCRFWPQRPRRAFAPPLYARRADGALRRPRRYKPYASPAFAQHSIRSGLLMVPLRRPKLR